MPQTGPAKNTPYAESDVRKRRADSRRGGGRFEW